MHTALALGYTGVGRTFNVIVLNSIILALHMYPQYSIIKIITILIIIYNLGLVYMISLVSGRDIN